MTGKQLSLCDQIRSLAALRSRPIFPQVSASNGVIRSVTGLVSGVLPGAIVSARHHADQAARGRAIFGDCDRRVARGLVVAKYVREGRRRTHIAVADHEAGFVMLLRDEPPLRL